MSRVFFPHVVCTAQEQLFAAAYDLFLLVIAKATGGRFRRMLRRRERPMVWIKVSAHRH